MTRNHTAPCQENDRTCDGPQRRGARRCSSARAVLGVAAGGRLLGDGGESQPPPAAARSCCQRANSPDLPPCSRPYVRAVTPGAGTPLGARRARQARPTHPVLRDLGRNGTPSGYRGRAGGWPRPAVRGLRVTSKQAHPVRSGTPVPGSGPATALTVPATLSREAVVTRPSSPPFRTNSSTRPLPPEPRDAQSHAPPAADETLDGHQTSIEKLLPRVVDAVKAGNAGSAGAGERLAEGRVPERRLEAIGRAAGSPSGHRFEVEVEAEAQDIAGQGDRLLELDLGGRRASR